MRTRRAVVLWLSVVVVATACGQPRVDLNTVRAAIAHTQAMSYRIHYSETAEDRVIAVNLDVDDSFRSHLKLSVQGVSLFEEVLTDDAVSLRLLAADRWNPAKGTPLEATLGSGRWVTDPAGAPPVILATSAQTSITKTGIDYVADAVNSLTYVRTVMEASAGVVKFNESSLDYRPSEDPFKSFIKSDKATGFTRYDAIPLLLPRSSEGNRGNYMLPDARFFRKLAIYVKGGTVRRVLEVIDFEHHREIVKAKKAGKPKFLLDMLSGLRQGAGENPVRPREMAIDVLDSSGGVRVTLPHDALTANLGSLLQSPALQRLPSVGQATTPSAAKP